MVLKNTGLKKLVEVELGGNLAAEAVQGAALALERVDDVHRRHCLAARVLGVRDRVADHVLEEDLEDAARLLINKAADSLYPASSCESTDSRLRYALDVVMEHFAMSFCTALRG